MISRLLRCVLVALGIMTVFITVYWSTSAGIVRADTPGPPEGLTLAPVGYYGVEINWNLGSGAAKTMIRRQIGAYPETINDGELAYYDTGEYCLDTGGEVALDLNHAVYFYRAWSQAADEDWSSEYAQAQIGIIDPLTEPLTDLAEALNTRLGEFDEKMQTMNDTFTLAVMLIFALGLAFFAVKANDIMIYTAAFLGILIIGYSIAETTLFLGVAVGLVGGYMMYRGIRLYY